MPPVFEKLSLKQQEIPAVNAPPPCEPAIQALEGAVVLRDPARNMAILFALAFTTTHEDWSALRWRRVQDIKPAKAVSTHGAREGS